MNLQNDLPLGLGGAHRRVDGGGGSGEGGRGQDDLDLRGLCCRGRRLGWQCWLLDVDRGDDVDGDGVGLSLLLLLLLLLERVSLNDLQIVQCTRSQ